MALRLSDELFKKSFELVPRVALNLIITDFENRLLLTKRAKPPFIGVWHFPGSYLLKDEPLDDCLVRIAKTELDLNLDPKEAKLLGVFEDLKGDPRGHVIDIMYGIKVESLSLKAIGDTKEMQFFDSLPENIGFNHKDTLQKLGFK